MLARIGVHLDEALAFQIFNLLDLILIYLVEASRGKVLDLDTKLTTYGSANLVMALTRSTMLVGILPSI